MSEKSVGERRLSELLSRYATAQPGEAGGARCQLVPPFMTQQIAMNGSERQRRAAMTSLLIDVSVRQQRALTPRPSALRPRPGPFAGRGRGPGRGAGSALGLQRTISDCDNKTVLPGRTVRTEGSDVDGDVAVDEAYDGLGATYAFYADVLGRDSIDDAGMPLLASVHYDVDYDNAFWDGRQMVFGDGDGELFNRFTISLDVIGHELTHGVTADEAGLAYQGQSGALNESVSDGFGSLVKQYSLGQTADEADWLIGEGLFTDAVQGVALRSMAAPGTAYDDPVLGKDPQPANMSGYVRTAADSGGVHINSGIPNHAFYLAATALGGYAWEGVGEVWYQTLLSPGLQPRANFRRFAKLTVQTASALFGPGSAEAEAVLNAWDQVGLPVGAGARRRRGLAADVDAAAGGRAILSSAESPWFSEAAAQAVAAAVQEATERRAAARGDGADGQRSSGDTGATGDGGTAGAGGTGTAESSEGGEGGEGAPAPASTRRRPGRA